MRLFDLSDAAVLAVSPAIGSLLGVLIRRLPAGRPVVFARSACDACGATLTTADLVPLLSYAWFRGRCRHCAAPIGSFHPAIELAALGVGLWAVVAAGGTAALWPAAVLGWGLLALGWTDWEYLVLPHALTMPLLAAGLLATAWLDPSAVTEHALAAAFGYLTLWAVAAVYRRARGRDGLGMGDAALLASAGAWVGVTGLPSVLLIGALLGIALLLGVRAARRDVGGALAVPFGAPLAAAIWIVFMYDPLATGCCVLSPWF